MAMMDLQITVCSDRAEAVRCGGSPVNIAELLSRVPTAGIVEGDPTVSVRVKINEEHRGLLLEAVKDVCVVNDFAYLELYDIGSGWPKFELGLN